MNYEEFCLQIESDGGMSYTVRILRSPYSGGSSAFQIPYPLEEIPKILTALEQEVWRTGPPSRRGSFRDIALSTEQISNSRAQAEQIGADLFNALFPGPILESYLLSRGCVEARENTGLRIHIIIDPSRPDLAPLCSLPWELLYRPQKREFLSRNPLTTVVRHFDITQTIRPISLDSGLRILVAMANPRGSQPLNLRQERQWIENAWGRDSSVKLTFLERANFRETIQQLRNESSHILHFIGHGLTNPSTSEGSLAFEGSSGEAEFISGEILAEHLKPIRSLRLVFLNACGTARFPRKQGQDPYTGIAAALVLKGIPSVLAMQFPIPDKAAAFFSDDFYSALASGMPVDAAIAEGRLAILRAFPSSLSWATPVLFSSVPNGKLFSPLLHSPEPETIAPKDPKKDAAQLIDSEMAKEVQGFANRELELSRLTATIEAGNTDRPHLEVWLSQPASGVSYFLRQASRLLRKKGIVLYVDCASQVQNTVFSQIVLALFNHYASAWRRFQAFAMARSDKKGGAGNIQAALIGIPYVGSALTQVAIKPQFQMEASHFTSTVAELVCEFLSSLTKEATVLVLLDNAQDMDDWSLDLLRTTIGRPYCGLRYIMTVVQRDGTATEHGSKLLLRNLEASYDISHIDFPPPDTNFVRSLAATYGLEISLPNAESLVSTAEANIYRILSALQDIMASHAPVVELVSCFKDLNPVEKEIVRLIAVAQQSLRRSDILGLCMNSALIFVDHEYEIDQAIMRLSALHVITTTELPDGDTLATFTGGLASLPDVSTSSPYKLVTAERLYSYFSRASIFSQRHSPSEVIPLLYRLSKLIDPESTSRFIQKILTISLQMGSMDAAERFIGKATLGKEETLNNYEDFLVRAIFYLSARSYEKALKTLEHPADADWSRYRVVNILRAVALNRARCHEVADALFGGLLRTSESKEESVILAAYKIAGKLHMNDVDGAKNFFQTYRPLLASAENFGYLLRNAASAFPALDAVEILSEALQYFEGQGDRFGFATALANRSMDILYLGDFERAYKDAKAAYDLLEIFGIHHLYIITTNLGIILMKMKNYKDSESFMWRALAISRTKMPIIYQKINLAAVFALTERKEEALRLIRDIEPAVEKHEVDRVRQRYYIDAAAIGTLCEIDQQEIIHYCQNALLHPDRKNRRMTQFKVGQIQSKIAGGKGLTKAEFEELFSPCSLSYWYQNPVESLPADILSSKAMV